jgi:hypothetical protein
MPALNVDFTDDELAALREAARSSGKSLKAYVHDVVDDELAAQRARAVAAETFRAFAAAHAEAFDAAFPEDAPGAGRRGAA